MNKQNKKVNFFKKIILSITDFRFYPAMLKNENLAQSIGYFLLLLLILTFIMASNFFDIALNGIDAMLARYEEKIPEFNLSDGVLYVEGKTAYKPLNDLVILVDTDIKYEEIDSIESYTEYDVYNNRLFVNSDAITYESELGYQEIDGKEAIQIVQLPFNEVKVNYNKVSLLQYIETIREANTTKIALFIFLFISTFVTYLFTKFFEVLLYAVMTALVAAISGIKLNFKNYLKISLYVITLPYILETISVLTVGGVTDNSFIISNLIAYIYILYAVRAVKLDAVILIMNNSGKMKKSKDGKTLISIDEENDSNEAKSNEEQQNEGNKTDDDSKANDNDNMQE